MSLPLTGGENQPMVDASGRVISTHEYGDVFQRVANERAQVLLLLEHMSRAIEAATGPNAAPADTMALITTGRMADGLLSAARQDKAVQYPFLSELLPPLTALYREYLAERDATYDMCTNDDGEFATVDDKLAVKAMDEKLDAAAKALKACGVKL